MMGDVGNESGSVEGNSSQEKLGLKQKFRDEWKVKFPWLRCIMQGDKTIMKCSWCEQYKTIGPWGTGNGCVTLQHDSIKSHATSSAHKHAMARWSCEMEKQAKPISLHVSKIDNANKNRVITTMKLMYFIAQRDFSLSSYEDLCSLAMTLNVPNMPKNVDYSSYTNRKAGNQFLMAISDQLLELQIVNVLDSPFYSIMLDESTDQGLELHLIIYANYLSLKGVGTRQFEYMGILKIADGKGMTVYDSLKAFLSERGMSQEKMIYIATDGASAMVGNDIGTVTLLKKDVPNLITVHCVAHREALAAADAAKIFPELMFVEKLANKVYSWVNNSSKRNNELMCLLKAMQLEALRALQIHNIRWLSRGQVIKRLVTIMPAILTIWKKEKLVEWYNKARIFSVQFCLHMLADVLEELNALNLKFQQEHIDFPSVGTSIDLAIINLSRKFLRDGNTGISFAEGTTYLSKFLECSKSGYLKNTDKDGNEYLHELIFKEVPNANEVLERQRAQGMRPCIDGSLDACIELTKDYIQAIVDGLNARFPDLPLFNATKLFSPCHYVEDTSIREANAKRWLDKLLDHLQPDSNHDGNVNVLFDRNGCNRDLYGFIDTMHLNCESFTMQEAWRVFCRMKDWQDSFPNIMKLWQAILVIPVSTVQCERGFSKQNTIKDIRRTSLSVEMLDALMRVSLTGPKIDKVDFDHVFEIWKSTKDRRIIDV